MKRKFTNVYQFRIDLADIRPPIWRRIQVPEAYTFWDLHVAIQDSMGWLDYHLHEFEIMDPSSREKCKIGIPDEEFGYEKVFPGWRRKIADYFSLENPKAKYVYDFGDYWVHNLKLEKILPREKGVKYPRCIKGKRACPPEDCGGTGGYEEFLEAIMNPKHEEHEEMLRWIGGEFDPEYFDPKEVVFEDPDKRFKIAFG